MGSFHSRTKAAAHEHVQRTGIKERLKDVVARLLRGDRKLTREEIAQEGGLKLASVCSVVNALVKDGKLKVDGTKRNAETGMQNELVSLA
ncbi:hypothetical protein ACJBUE_20810 (plasmid) [Ralstonia syzygii subsp. celebesensis]|uniref:Uncharacterized protein n=1 Tax=blood disease bacterium R229 TaxID=741978 RepID=G2ZVX9_9RALS|nr:hypothetical protein [Ralstonia syzygii]QQV57840.1 hypothetical protein JK151_20655 [Ralstonia syzygii subsp. celebesensis]CCA83260.1 hypothetical protein BDB_mp60426 [blood disease bacterium R229]